MRFLLISDTHGKLAFIDALAAEVRAEAVIHAGRLMAEGISARRACQVGVVWALTDERDVQRSIEEVVSSIFE